MISAARCGMAVFCAALLSSSALALDNADFSQLRAGYASGAALSGWVPLLAGAGQFVVESVDFAHPGARTGNVGYFDSLTSGYGDNKLDQCLSFDRAQDLVLQLHVRTNAADLAGLGVRVNPRFYADMQTCHNDVAANATTNALGGTNANVDWDLSNFSTAGVTRDNWHARAPIEYAAGATPTGATAVRLSLRARDQGVPSPQRRIFFGAIELQNGGSVAALTNGDFAVAPLTAGQRVLQDGLEQGWIVDSGTLTVENAAFAAAGANVLGFPGLTEDFGPSAGFGTNRIDQCVELPTGRDFGVALQARSPAPDAALMLRANVRFFSDAGCSVRAGTTDLEEDFPVNGPADQWQWLETSAPMSWSALQSIGATHARLSLRARNRSAAPRMLYVDRVFVPSLVGLSPAPGDYASAQMVTITVPDGMVARYTLDGSAPVVGSAVVSGPVTIAASAVLSVRFFDLAGNPVSGVMRAHYVVNVSGAPWFEGLDGVSALSGVVGDASDALSLTGLTFAVGDAETPAANLSVSVASSHPAVLPSSGLAIERTGAQVVLRLTPVGVGYATVTVTVRDGDDLEASHSIQYAASAHASVGTQTRWYSGRSDASGAVSLGGGRVMVIDDEGDHARVPRLDNALAVYDLAGSGAPLVSLSLDDQLGLRDAARNCAQADHSGLGGCESSGEVDLEAAFRVGSRIYVTGSHSNNANGRSRADRWRFFAGEVSGSGAATTLTATGYYRWLREDLRAWDASGGHGLGADYLGLTASSNGGDPNPALAPESPNRDGFSIEGLSLSPGGDAAWFAFRAPLVSAPGAPAVQHGSAAGRTHALIVPVHNHDALVTQANGGAKGLAQIGQPIRLDLGERGIREIRRNDAGQYLIIAGPPQSATGVAPLDFRLYQWDGSVDAQGEATNLVLRPESLAAFSPPQFAGSPEGIASMPDDLDAGGEVDIVSDNGDVVFYGDGVAAKDLVHNAHKKFRIDRVSLAAIGGQGAQCGPAHDEAFSSTPANGLLCDAGSASMLSGGASGPWLWRCEGAGGSAVLCSANPVALPPAGAAPVVPDEGDWSALPDRFGSGVPDYVQSLVPSLDGATLGDGNGDGIADRLQPNVVSLPVGGDQYLTLASAAAGHALSQVRREALPGDLPAGATLPFGLVGFRVSGLATGATEEIVAYVPYDARINGWLKRNLDTGRWENIAEQISRDGEKTRIVLRLRDGGPYDADRAANGAIDDPGGPVILGAVTAIPVLPPWAMAFLVLALLATATWPRRRA